MKITYLDHSGFAVEYKKYVLIFDWYKGKLPEFDSEKEIYVFSSHSHYDHFDRKIFELENIYPNIRYVLSADITEKPVPSKVWFVIADKEYRIGNLKVQTLHSTDAGVAFLVYVDDRIIYHAGDLNWWHWEEESEYYNEQMRMDYQKEIHKLKNIRIDVAFVPLDPRQEEQYYWGLDYFMKHTDTELVFPMHMWGHYEVYEKLMNNPQAESYKEHVMHVKGTRTGIRIAISLKEIV